MLYLNFSKYYELSCNKLPCTMHFNAHTQTFLWAIHAELEVLVADVHTCAALVDTDKQFLQSDCTNNTLSQSQCWRVLVVPLPCQQSIVSVLLPPL